jgi:hypothetical protein
MLFYPRILLGRWILHRNPTRVRRLELRCRPPLGWRMGRSTAAERQRKH